MLTGHDEIASLGELLGRRVNFRKNQGDHCSCGERFDNCPSIREFSTAFEKVHSFSFNPFLPQTALASSSWFFRRTIDYPASHDLKRRLIGRTIHSLPFFRSIIKERISLSASAASLYAGLNNASVYLDSSKKAIRAYYFVRYYTENTYVVLLTRDGRATVTSIMKNLGVESVKEAGRIWRNTILSKQKLYERVSSDRRIRLRYEDLCSRPSDTLAPVFKMLGIKEASPDNVIDPSHMHVSGNRMSRKGRQEITLNEGWKDQLSTNQLDVFNRHFSKLNSRFGYS